MSRSGYNDDYDESFPNASALFQANVDRALKGKRGRAFLQELAAAMDQMPEKMLIAGELVTPEGACCTMGVVFKARGIDVSKIDYHDPEMVGDCLGIPEGVAREIAFENDDDFRYIKNETPEARWQRMRKWVAEKLEAPCKSQPSTN